MTVSLLSFGKYLELLVYSPKLHDLHPTLCEHTSSSNVTSLTSDPRLNILRHFSYQTQKLTFSLSVIEDVFDVHVPRLQLLKASNDKPLESTSVTSPALTAQNLGDADEAKRALRKEIVGWWQEVSDYVERLVCVVWSTRCKLTNVIGDFVRIRRFKDFIKVTPSASFC